MEKAELRKDLEFFINITGLCHLCGKMTSCTRFYCPSCMKKYANFEIKLIDSLSTIPKNIIKML
jgi:hypothetical protein